MVKNQYLLVESVSKGIARIVLNRPEKHHALNIALMEELCHALTALEDSGCQVVILGAQGENFCSGMDLKEAAEEALIEKMGRQLASLFIALHTTSLVTIAAIQGHAIAGGGGLAASCDLVLMADNARIGFPETQRGIVAAQVAAILIRLLSVRHVKELLLTGQLIDSQRAVEIGLATRLVEQERLHNESVTLAKEIMKGAPKAIKETKRLIGKLIPGDFGRDLERALAVHHQARISQEGKEGIAAFLEKREPRW